MAKIRTINFEIIKEPWNKYQISDNSVLRTRTILKKVERITEGEKISFTMDAQTLTVVDADETLRGTPSRKVNTKEELMKSIEKEDMRYDTLSQEFNEYQLDDGTKIKIFTHVSKIARTSLKDAKGDPIYSVASSSSIEIKPSDQYKTQSK